MPDYPEINDSHVGPVYRFERGPLLAVVEAIGGGSWGYTLWDGPACVDGAKNYEWSAADACERAKAALATHKRASRAEVMIP